MAKPNEVLRKLPKVTETMPNIPSFDFDPKNGKPNIREGEKVLAAKLKNGVPTYVTDQGRVVYVCSLDEFETKFHGFQPRRVVFEHYFPWANGEVKKFALNPKDEPLGDAPVKK